MFVAISVPNSPGEKLFEETGTTTSFKITKVHPVEGITIEISFTSDLKGFGRFPSGKNLGSGTATQYPHGVVDAVYQGAFMIGDHHHTQSEQGQGEDNDIDNNNNMIHHSSAPQYVWWAHEKSKVIGPAKTRGLTMVSGFTNSKKFSWMNNLIMALEIEVDYASSTFKAVAYEWK